MRLQYFLILLILAASICACTPPDRPPTSNDMEVVITGESFNKMRWYVPAGEVIQVRITNQTEEPHIWSLFEPSSPNQTGFSWYSETVAPGDTISVRFEAPTAAGEYDMVSTGQSSNTRVSAEIVVVQP